MQVLSATASLVLLFFCFRFEKLVIFAVYLTYAMEAFLNFLLLLFDSSVFAKHPVIYLSIQHTPMPCLLFVLLINVMLVCHCNVLFYCCCAF